MKTEPPGLTRGTRKTRQLAPGDWVITPDGARRGMVRRTYPAGILGEHPGSTTVQFHSSSVSAVNGSDLPSPRAWVTCDDEADWSIERWAWRPEEPEIAAATTIPGLDAARRTS